MDCLNYPISIKQPHRPAGQSGGLETPFPRMQKITALQDVMIALNSQKGFAAWRAWITQISCEKRARSREEKDFVQSQSCSVVFGNGGARRDSPSTASTQVVRR